MIVARGVIMMPVRVGYIFQDQMIILQKSQDFQPCTSVDGHGLRPAVKEIGQIIPVAKLLNVEHVIPRFSLDNFKYFPGLRIGGRTQKFK